jgi:hypothetical protein
VTRAKIGVPRRSRRLGGGGFASITEGGTEVEKPTTEGVVSDVEPGELLAPNLLHEPGALQDEVRPVARYSP